jgi:hypothetical protein
MQTDLATSWLEIRLFGRALFGLGIVQTQTYASTHGEVFQSWTL